VNGDVVLERDAKERFFAARPDSEITNGVIPEEKHRDAPLRMTGAQAGPGAVARHSSNRGENDYTSRMGQRTIPSSGQEGALASLAVYWRGQKPRPATEA
jgi:hypothetical protein